MFRYPVSLALATLLGGCAIHSNGSLHATDGATIALVPGQTVTLANSGGSLRYVHLVNDSRCAPEVQCVWAGDAVIALRWVPIEGAARELQLHSNTTAGPNHADLDARRVTFIALTRQSGEATLLVSPMP